MKKWIGMLLVVAILVTTVAAYTATTAADDTTPAKKIVVDGNLDVWYTTEELDKVNTFYFPELDAFYKSSGTAIYDEANIFANVWTAYDDEYIYVYVKVWDHTLIYYNGDDKVNFRDSSWADSIEIWLDPDPESQTHYPDGREKPQEEIQDGFWAQTKDPEQGDIQVRLIGYDFRRHDYHNITKPNYPGTFGQWVNDNEHFCPFYFDNDPISFENNWGDTIELDHGYGVEAHFPRHDDGSDHYRLNVAVNNSPDYNDAGSAIAYTHYALAIGGAWWLSFPAAAAIHMDPETPFYKQDVTGREVVYTNSIGNAKGEAVVSQIAELPATVTEANRAVVEKIVADYAALSDIQRGYVKIKNYDVLQAAAEALGVELPTQSGTITDTNVSSQPGNTSQPSDPSSVEPAGIRGDVDGNQKVNASDALLALKASVGKVNLTPAQFALADLDGNQKINASDALAILKIAVGK